MGAEATLGKRCANDGNTFHHDVTAATGPRLSRLIADQVALVTPKLLDLFEA